MAALVVACSVGFGGLFGTQPALARSSEPATVGVSVPLAQLPSQARATYQRVLSGGPFPFSKDGIVFRNRERLLPSKPRGHYREYTVQSPGSRDRGARRIVCGGRAITQPEACYYTDDHYSSFRRIEP